MIVVIGGSGPELQREVNAAKGHLEPPGQPLHRLKVAHRILVQLMKRVPDDTARQVLKGTLIAWSLHNLPESDAWRP